MNIPELSQYSSEEIKTACQHSSAINRYWELRNKNTVDLSDQLRQQRHRAWLRASLATLYKKARTEQICYFWSQAAIDLIQQAWNQCMDNDSGLSLIAFGKLGALELNLSSDIDLAFVSQSISDKKQHRVVKEFIQLLGETTKLGFCFRIDTDLRPGGRLGPLISSIDQIEHYYWTQGQVWERLALVRAQVICGSDQGKQELHQLFNRYVYRKFLDYTLLEEFKFLRSQIQGQQLQQDFNLKLSAGGIRDIELFINALQVIRGSQYPELQISSTQKAIELLKKNNIYSAEALQFLLESYWFYRDLENQMQIYSDQQTHKWKPKHYLGDNSENLTKEIIQKSSQIDSIVKKLVGESLGDEVYLEESEDGQILWLKQLGFNERSINETWPALMKNTALSRSLHRDELARKAFLYDFITELGKTALDKDVGLSLLLDFVKALRVKATFFSLFNNKPQLVKEIALLFGASPYLAGIFTSRPDLIDSFMYRRQGEPSEDMGVLLEQLAEKKWLNEVITASQFLSEKNINNTTKKLTRTADDIALSLSTKLKEMFPKSSVSVLAMGKWGGQELGFQSDLDFIFVTNKSPIEDDYRFAKRFIAHITEQHRGGSIYNVDLRLRPSGHAGPLIVSTESLVAYLTNKAHAWEKEAYLKARLINEDSLNLHTTLIKSDLKPEEILELKDIKLRLLKAQKPRQLQLKYNWGGLIDIELATQAALLNQQEPHFGFNQIEQMNFLAKENTLWTQLKDIYQELRTREQLYQLLSPSKTLHQNSDSVARLAKILNTESQNLFKSLFKQLSRSSDLLNQLDPSYHQRS